MATEMKESTLVGLEKLFLALSDKTRLRLLAIMAEGEVSVGYLADTLGESQPKTSRHLAYLRSSGLVSTRRDGKWIYYGLDTDGDAAVMRVLNATLTSILGDDAGRPHVPHPIISADTHIDDWSPAEIEIFLL